MRPRGHLFAAWDPDVLDVGGLAQELAALALTDIKPVAGVSSADPGALHVAGRGVLDRAQNSGATIGN